MKRFDPEVEAQDTPLERRPELYHGVSPTARSNFFRFVVLYKYGGVYADMDTMFLRDMRFLLGNEYFYDEFCYRWSAHLPYGNSAILRLRQLSGTAGALLKKCAADDSCRPGHVLRFSENGDLGLLVLPCPFFDPLWPHRDHQDRYDAAHFHKFEDFFRRFGGRFRRQRTIHSYRDFFPGTFAYHWHNCWDAPEHEDSYFGFFNQEFNSILQDRLGVEVTDA